MAVNIDELNTGDLLVSPSGHFNLVLKVYTGKAAVWSRMCCLVNYKGQLTKLTFSQYDCNSWLNYLKYPVLK